MEIFECIEARFSYRGAYKNTPVPRKDLEKILKAGVAAHSGCNKQTASFIAIDNAKILSSICELIRKDGAEENIPPAGICVLTQQIPGYAKVYFNVQDYAAACENLLLAITALGYASCWIEGQVTANEKTQAQIAKLLSIPKDYEVVAFLPIGLSEESINRPQYKPFEDRAWFNKFGNR